MNYHVVSRLLGAIILLFSSSLVTAVPFALIFREFQALVGILESLAIGGIAGALLYMIGKHDNSALFRREALAVVGMGWLAVAAVGALPFHLGGMTHSYTDAYFESMSGLTTTGASILRSIETQDKSMLFWRSFLHFVGGMGIIVFFVAILPVLGVGGKKLFMQEVPGPVPEGVTPRIKDTALALCKIYIALNVIEFVVLMFCGMSPFDALNHAMATMATGGFSTRDSSIGFYTPVIEWVIVLFMFLAGTNFTLHLKFIRGDYRCYFRDAEFRAYLGIVLGAAVFLAVVLLLFDGQPVSQPGELNFRDGLFTTVSILTTTGFGTVDFNQWPSVCHVIIIVLMFVGGMAGSTAGGMKVIRWVILAQSARISLRRERTPRIVRSLKLDGRALDPRMQNDVFVFFFIYMAVFLITAVLVALFSPHQGLLTAITATAACLNNIGPGLDAVGPATNYADCSAAAKWILSVCMVMGRLELYAILVILNPHFWLGR